MRYDVKRREDTPEDTLKDDAMQGKGDTSKQTQLIETQWAHNEPIRVHEVLKCWIVKGRGWNGSTQREEGCIWNFGWNGWNVKGDALREGSSNFGLMDGEIR